MDTQTSSAPKLPPIRTYAKDLELKRKTQNLPPEETVPEPAKETPKMAAAVEVKTKPPKVGIFKRAPQPSPSPEVVAVTPLPPLSSIAKKGRTPLPKMVDTDTRETDFIVDNEDAAAATIITDTKRDRFKLFPSILTSIRSWFSDKKKSYAAKKAPKYTVPETTRRKGVIQKATSNTGKFTSSDFESIQDRIRQRKEVEEKPKATTTWSANTEPGFALLEGEVAAPKVVNVQVVARKSFRAPTPTPAPLPTPAPAPVVVVKKVTPPPSEEPVAPITPPPQPPTEVETEVNDEEPATSAPSPESLPTRRTASAETVPFSLLQVRTNLLAVGFSGLVFVLAAVGLYGYFVFQSGAGETTLTEASASPLFTTSALSVVPLRTIDDQSITEALTVLQNDATGLSEVIFVEETTPQKPISAQLLFTAMKLTAPRDFAQAITDIRFGFIEDTPYLYLAITDEAVARGGLLAWERDVYTSFQDIFSMVLLPEETAPAFIDATLSGRDVRVLKHTGGQDVLLYTLVAGGVIITTGSTPLAELITQLP